MQNQIPPPKHIIEISHFTQDECGTQEEHYAYAQNKWCIDTKVSSQDKWDKAYQYGLYRHEHSSPISSISFKSSQYEKTSSNKRSSVNE